MRGSQIYEDLVIRFEAAPQGQGYRARVTVFAPRRV